MPTPGAMRLLTDEKLMGRALFLTTSFLFCSILLLVQARAALNNIIASDGIGYFAHLPSILLDRDINFQDEFAVFNRQDPRNHWPIGTAVAWLPFFFLGHLYTRLSSFVGYDLPMDGTAYPEQLACCLGSVILGCAGIVLCFRLACRWLEPRWALLGSVTLLVCSNLPYYMVVEPYMSHSVSVFWVSLLLYLGTDPEPLTRKRALLLGLLGGLAALTRPQDGLFLVVPFLYQYGSFPRINKLKLLTQALSAGLLSLVVFSPQFFLWTHNVASYPAVERLRPDTVSPENWRQHQKQTKQKQRHRSKFKTSELVPGGQYHWLKPEVISQLFGWRNGLFRFHPAFLIALLGLLLMYRKHKIASAVFLTGFAMQAYIIGMWGGQGQTFGGRMFLCCYPVFVVGTGYLYSEFGKKGRWALLSAHVLLMLWNAWSVLVYRNWI